MSFTLFETLLQIDPYVRLNNGAGTLTVQQIIGIADSRETTEYLLHKDAVGRLVISQLDHRGRLISPPAFIEERSKPATESAEDLKSISGLSSGPKPPGRWLA